MTISKPILLDLPEIIETDRLRLCLPKIGDGIEVNRAILSSMGELRRWVGWVHPEPSIEDNEEFVRRSIGQWHLRTQFSLLIRLKTTNELVGGTGFHAIDWSLGRFETGYWCKSAQSSKGYITEATKAMTQFAFETLKATRLEIRCDADNIRSRKIPEKLNFNLEAQLKNYNRRFDDQSLGTQLIYTRYDANGL